MNRQSIDAAIASLRGRDPILAGLIERHGSPPPRRTVPAGMRFAELVRSIIFQQLAGRAASTIHDRFVAGLGGEVTPRAIESASPEMLRSCGLSGAKAASVKDLANKVAAGDVSLERAGRLDDESLIDHLIAVRGIGRWTAQMFLLGTLGREDVWPTGDYGVRAGYASAWGLQEIPSPKELAVLGEPFQPHRSIVAWYCWRAADERNQTPRSI